MLRVILGALLLVCLTNAATTVEKSSKEETKVELLKVVEDTDVSDVADEVPDVAEERKDVIDEEAAKVLEEGEEVLQDEAEDRFVDLSVDVSFGTPKLGYVYHGLHSRGPKREGKGGNYVVGTHLEPSGTQVKRQTFQTNFDFDSDFQDIRQQFHPTDPEHIAIMIQETHPGLDGFVTPRPAREPIAAQQYVVEPTYPTTVASVSNTEQFNYPPYVSPESVSPSEEIIHIAPTKPPLHMKIAQDLGGLMSGMKSMLMGLKPKQGSTSPFKLPTLPGLPGLPSLPKASSTPFKLKMPTLPQAEGKPPLHIKMAQDLNGLMGSLKNIFESNEVVSSYGAPEPSYEAPAPSYNAPSPSYDAPSFSYDAPSFSYDAPAASYSPSPSYSPEPTYEEPEIYQPPTYPKQGTVERENMLQKFVTDIDKVNKWLARQTLEVMNDGQPFKFGDFPEFPFELPEIPTLKKVQQRLLNKRQDEVMKYMTSPDLSKKQN